MDHARFFIEAKPQRSFEESNPQRKAPGLSEKVRGGLGVQTSLFSSVPMPSISTATRSPAFSQLLAALQNQGLLHGHDAAGNDSVLMGIGQIDGVLFKQVGNVIVSAQLLRVVAAGVIGVVGIANIEFYIKHAPIWF